MRDVENRVVNSDKLRVGEDGIPNFPRPAGVPREWEKHCRLMMDMIALSIQSDSTRILTFMYANEGNNRGYPEIGAPEGHHDLSHHGKSSEKQEKVQKINTHSRSTIRLSGRPALEHPGGERSLLDNCMIVYGSGISPMAIGTITTIFRSSLSERPVGGFKKGATFAIPRTHSLCNLYLWMLQQMGVKEPTALVIVPAY